MRCLYTLLHAPRENHEALLRELVLPVVRELRGSPELESLFFARYNLPDWQLRFRVLGEPGWIEGPVRRRVERALPQLQAQGLIHGHEFAAYQREYERYGGPQGMALAESIFLHDTVACLELIDAEGRGELGKSRREYSLLFTERFLDSMGFEPERRIAFYAYGYSWPLKDGTWDANDLATLETRFRSLQPGLIELLWGEESSDDAAWGGPEIARIARTSLDASRPVVEAVLSAHAAGRLEQDLVYLAWSYAHMHCNRLGIDALPEAILRFFMHRLYQERETGAKEREEAGSG